jgi:DNA-binding CsgD family transcriptional regulator
MSEAASQLSPASRLRVAVHALDLPRRNALCWVVAEAGHLVVGLQDAADVVLADGDLPPGETRAIVTLGVTLGGADRDLGGVLSREAGASQIDAAIRAVAAGLIVRLPDPIEAGFGAIGESDAHALLTPRELEVLAALAEGLTNKAIARRLNISLHTVKFHIESLFRKLGARTRTEAVAKASERRRYETINL